MTESIQIMCESCGSHQIFVGDTDNQKTTKCNDCRRSINIKDAAKKAYESVKEDLGESLISFSFKGYEVIDRTVKPHSTSAHVGTPKSWIGHRVVVIRLD